STAPSPRAGNRPARGDGASPAHTRQRCPPVTIFSLRSRPSARVRASGARIDSGLRRHSIGNIEISGEVMHTRTLRSVFFLLAAAPMLLVAGQLPPVAKAAPAPRFHLEEATIAEVQRAIRAKEITAEQLVRLYFKRIDAYNGTCVR